VSYGLANRTDGAGFEPTARWLVNRAIRIEPHIHVIDRSRVLVAKALGHRVDGPPIFGLLAKQVNLAPTDARTSDETKAGASHVDAPILVLVHGTSRDDKLWPESNWIELGRRAIAQGWQIALPHAGAVELERAQRIAAALGDAARVWPQMSLDAMVDRLGQTQGVIGVDSGLSHIAVALNLPHVQIYNWPTSWRTGPAPEHGHAYQVSVEAQPTPSLDAVWTAWTGVREAAT
jgi:heptosyltransferase-1